MKKKHYVKSILLLLSLMFLVFNPALAFNESKLEDEPEVLEKLILADGEFVFGPQLLDIDFKEYIHKNFPELSSHADLLVNLSYLHSINPQVVLSIITLYPNDFAPTNSTFEEDIKNLFLTLSNYYYGHGHQDVYSKENDRKIYTFNLKNNGGNVKVSKKVNAGSLAVAGVLAELNMDKSNFLSVISDNTSDKSNFAGKYKELFGKDPRKSENNVIPGKEAADKNLLSRFFAVYAAPVGGPPDDYLQLPYPQGESWLFGGIHANFPGAKDRSSVDFSPNFKEWPLAENDNYTVVAAAKGEVASTYQSSCSTLIRHEDSNGNYNGWYTRYLHIEGIVVNIGDIVEKNAKIGIVAKTKAQAECLFSFPPDYNASHVHVNLLYNGELINSDQMFRDSAYNLNNVVLSGWKIYHDGVSNYSGDCSKNFFYKDNNNNDSWDTGEEKKCPYSDALLNPGCTPPQSGDWIVSGSCTFTGSKTAPANVIVQNNSVLRIANGASLKINNFTNHGILVKNGSGVLVENGGKLY